MSAPPSLNVRDFGAVGDGKTDDTAAVQKALDTATKAGGGIVMMPRGNYRIATHLLVPDNVTLQGVFTVPTAWSQMKGTTLLAEEGKGHEDGPPFISLALNATIKGLTVFYPGQSMDAITPYPWCVGCTGADNPSIVDCLLVNPYRAVDFATHNSGRHYIRGLYGQPLRTGIAVDKCYDVGRIENVHFWPFWGWDGHPKIQDFMRQNAEAFVFGRTDWEYVLNTFVLGYKIGYHFIATKDGPCNGNFMGIGSDGSVIAVQVDQCEPFGLLITNGEFVSMLEPEPTEVVVSASNTGVVQFNNCAFWGPSDKCATIRGTGAVSFVQCNFQYWDRANKGLPAIDCLGGELTVSSCAFRRPSPGVILGPAVKTAVIYGNTFAGKAQVTNQSAGDVQIGLNAGPK
jgi:hypothetical protein